MLSDTFLIIFIATCTAFVGEGLTYILVYRSDEYKRFISYFIDIIFCDYLIKFLG